MPPLRLHSLRRLAGRPYSCPQQLSLSGDGTNWHLHCQTALQQISLPELFPFGIFADPLLWHSSTEVRGANESSSKVWSLASCLSADLVAVETSDFITGSSCGVLVAATFGRGYLSLRTFLSLFGTLRVHFSWRSFF